MGSDVMTQTRTPPAFSPTLKPSDTQTAKSINQSISPLNDKFHAANHSSQSAGHPLYHSPTYDSSINQSNIQSTFQKISNEILTLNEQANQFFKNRQYINALLLYQKSLELLADQAISQPSSTRSSQPFNQPNNQSINQLSEADYEMITTLHFNKAYAFQCLNQPHLAFAEVFNQSSSQTSNQSNNQSINQPTNQVSKPHCTVKQLKSAIWFAYKCDQEAAFRQAWQRMMQSVDHKSSINQTIKTDESVSRTLSAIELVHWVQAASRVYARYLSPAPSAEQVLAKKNASNDSMLDEGQSANQSDQTNNQSNQIGVRIYGWTNIQHNLSPAQQEFARLQMDRRAFMYPFAQPYMRAYIKSLNLTDTVIRTFHSQKFDHVVIGRSLNQTNPSFINQSINQTNNQTINQERLGVFLKHSVKKGEIIMLEKPLFSASCDEDRCDFCSKALNTPNNQINQTINQSNSQPVSCLHCTQEVYCDTGCRDAAYQSYHSHACRHHWTLRPYRQAINQFGVSSSSRTTLMIIKILSRSFTIEGRLRNIWEANPTLLTFSVPDQINPQSNNQVDESGSYGLEFDNFWAMYVDVTNVTRMNERDKILFDYSTFEFLHRLLTHNLFKLSSAKQLLENTSGFGGALFQLTSLINHSCMPNVNPICRPDSQFGHHMQLTALQDMQTGEELYISYCPLYDNEAMRATALSVFGIVCQCQLCALQRDPTMTQNIQRSFTCR